MRLLPILVIFAVLLPQEPTPQPRAGDSERDQLTRDAQRESQKYAEQATRINQLAASIHTEQDAEKYVAAIRDLFGDELPRWSTGDVVRRVAKAEYAATARHELLPDDKIAAAFNELAREIAAPDWAQVTGPEIYALRDAHYSIAKISSARENLNIWTMPNMYAVESDGKISSGARPVEALYVLYTLNEMFDNMVYPRELMRQGKLASQLIGEKRQAAQSSSRELRTATTSLSSYRDKLRECQYAYIQKHGRRAYEKKLKEMFDRVIP